MLVTGPRNLGLETTARTNPAYQQSAYAFCRRSLHNISPDTTATSPTQSAAMLQFQRVTPATRQASNVRSFAKRRQPLVAPSVAAHHRAHNDPSALAPSRFERYLRDQTRGQKHPLGLPLA
jgi:hypothetical protein